MNDSMLYIDSIDISSLTVVWHCDISDVYWKSSFQSKI